MLVCCLDALGAWHHENSYPHNGGGDHYRYCRGLARPRPLVLNPARHLALKILWRPWSLRLSELLHAIGAKLERRDSIGWKLRFYDPDGLPAFSQHCLHSL
jgi:hypothetical protein